MAEKMDEKDEIFNVGTTNHVWDNIQELNNPLPRWWLWLFYLTIIWSIIYMIVMPAFPLITGYTMGLIGSSQREQVLIAYQSDVEQRAEFGSKLVESTFEEINSTPELLEFAMANGRSAFGDNCAPCHGSGGTGSVGYPNIQDDVWLWGGEIEDIHYSVNYGIRAEHDETRFNEMPAYGRDEIFSPEEIDHVASYAFGLSNPDFSNDADLEVGATLFAENCATCHGDNGQGIQELGGPSLIDSVWLYGNTYDDVRMYIDSPRHGVMPAWEGRLTPATIKSLAIYVHSLGGGVN